MFSEPQPGLRRLIDLSGFRWQPLAATEAGLSISATCTVATLNAFEAPSAWPAAELIGQCCRAFLASFKIWNMATTGGNLCMALPAGPMISLTAALCVGQRVAAIAAESEVIAEAARDMIKVEYELMPAVFDPEEAMKPGAPIVHDKPLTSRIANPQRNIVAELHGEVGDVEAGFARPM